MGLFGFLSKDGRDRRNLERNVARAVNKYAQSPDRYKALQGLIEDGTPEAIYGALRRFGMVYDKSIEDEQEKEWLFEALVEKGASVIPQVERYLQSADSISWPLRLLGKLAGKEHEVDVLTRILERHEPGYERDPTKKIQLLNHLADIKDPRAPALAVPYLVDMDEGVRYAAAEALVRLGNEDVAREALIEHFVADSEESLRVRLEIARGLVDRGWLIKTHRPAFDKKLPDQFSIDREGRLKKKS
ncbi:MAG: HEAT repeat domain-containing protein [Deltaproteobacteria bacterium]|nr:HEAT repeat domain-containing protein [Deltaproteobacteria bacterium]